MHRGPKGEKRPADAIGNAVHIMRIATGEAEDNPTSDHARLRGGRAQGSNDKPSPYVACSISSKPHNIINQTSQSLP